MFRLLPGAGYCEGAAMNIWVHVSFMNYGFLWSSCAGWLRTLRTSLASASSKLHILLAGVLCLGLPHWKPRSDWEQNCSHRGQHQGELGSLSRLPGVRALQTTAFIARAAGPLLGSAWSTFHGAQTKAATVSNIMRHDVSLTCPKQSDGVQEENTGTFKNFIPLKFPCVYLC